jgi:hypothetical protein
LSSDTCIASPIINILYQIIFVSERKYLLKLFPYHVPGFVSFRCWESEWVKAYI